MDSTEHRCCVCRTGLKGENYYRGDYERSYYICRDCRKQRNLSWGAAKFRLGWTKGIRISKAIWRRAEAITPKILREEGFTEITHIGDHFPFDYLCKKGEQIYAIEVSTDWRKAITQHKSKLMSFANWKILFLFIRPDFSEYQLIEMADVSELFVTVVQGDHAKLTSILLSQKTLADIEE